MAEPTLLNGKLVNADVKNFSAMRIYAEFTVVGDGNEGPGRQSAAANPDGTYRITLPPKEEWKGPLVLTVSGPSGLVLGRLKDIAADDDLGSLDITVAEDIAMSTVVPSSDPTLGSIARFSGRVIDSKGNPQRAGILVVIWGVTPGENDPHPVALGETVVGGYFAGEWPSETLSRAEARIAGIAGIPVPLDGDRLPRRIILVADDLPDEGKTSTDPPRAPTAEELATQSEAFADDVGCCATFTTPNRTVEEVVFNAVVRTTQPDIMGSSVRRPVKIPDRLIDRIVTLARAHPVMLDALSGREDVATQPAVHEERPTPREARFANTVRRAAALAQPEGNAVGLHEQLTEGPAHIAERAAVALEARNTRSAPLRLEPGVLSELAREPGGLTPARLLEAERTSLVRNFNHQLNFLDPLPVGRFDLSPSQQANWDAAPTPYQATTIAHGHLLTMKQVWRADGYSLGDVLYSLPLAPGQQKLISILDWERRDEVRRTEHRIATESLSATLSHDRDISDIVRSALHERMDAKSRASTSAVGGAIGGFIGPVVFGAAGGVSNASSSAQQASSRDIAASALNEARDRTLQASSAVRGQRTTVVQTARQGEAVRAQTEAIANNNHCHAMTVQYFEVLRHFQVSQEIAAVQECLFIPFAISPFSQAKALRWRHVLQDMNVYFGGQVIGLRPYFDALERVASNWGNVDYPTGRYADDTVRDLSGELWISLTIPRPADTDTHEFNLDEWRRYQTMLGASNDSDLHQIWQNFMGVALPEQRDAIWYQRVAPGAARRLFDSLTAGLWQGGSQLTAATLDVTLVSTFVPDSPLLVSFRDAGALGSFTRAQIDRLGLGFGLSNVAPQVRALVHSGTFRYRTDHIAHSLFEDYRIQNDLTGTDQVEISTPLDRQEKRNPRLTDTRMSRVLLDILNERLEYFHRLIWLAMDPNRRYMFLDGIVAPDAGGRSVASVVENRIIGIVGNSLVMPVVPGLKLDPTYEFAKRTKQDLRNFYATDPPPPMRISIPTKGVFAEAVMGKCNSCEKIDDTLFWRWDEAPIPDSPTAIQPLSTASRRQRPPSVTPGDFPDALVKYQAVPTAPDPTGLSAALSLLGTKDLFRNLTGLAMNQENAGQALKSVMSAAQSFASQGAALAQQQFMSKQVDRNLDLIKKARDAKQITPEQAQSVTEGMFKTAIGARKSDPSPVTDHPAAQKLLDKVNESKSGEVRLTRPGGTVEVKTGAKATAAPVAVAVDPAVAPVKQPSEMTCWAAAGTMMKAWREQKSMTIQVALDAIGADWRKKFDAGSGLSSSEVADFAQKIGLTEEGPMSYSVAGMKELVEKKGPLWVIADNDFAADSIVHARVITGMKGDGSIDGTKVTLADPTTGTMVEETFRKFSQRLEAAESVKIGRGIFHW